MFLRRGSIAFFLFFLLAGAGDVAAKNVPDELAPYVRSNCVQVCVSCSMLYKPAKGALRCASFIRPELEQCTSQCEQETERLDATDVAQEIAKDCRTTGVTSSECTAIAEKRDLITYHVNQRAGRQSGCPQGASYIPGTGCACDDKAAELDDFQTLCLNKENIKAKIGMILLSLPDEIHTAIVKKAQKEIEDASFGFIKGAKVTDDDIADYIYLQFIKNSKNFYTFLKAFDKKSIRDKVVAFLTAKRARKAPTPEQKKTGAISPQQSPPPKQKEEKQSTAPAQPAEKKLEGKTISFTIDLQDPETKYAACGASVSCSGEYTCREHPYTLKRVCGSRPEGKACTSKSEEAAADSRLIVCPAGDECVRGTCVRVAPYSSSQRSVAAWECGAFAGAGDAKCQKEFGSGYYCRDFGAYGKLCARASAPYRGLCLQGGCDPKDACMISANNTPECVRSAP